MKVKLTQKNATIDGNLIAYVSTVLFDGKGHKYPCMFDKNTKKRYNAFCKSKGFVIGRVDTPPLDKEIYLKGE